MLNLLIANNNLQNLQDLLNYISQYIPDIRISYLAKSGRELLYAVNRYHFDIILMDQKLPLISGFRVIDILSRNKEVNFEKSIIFLSNNETIINKVSSSDLIFKTLYNTNELSKIIFYLKKLIETKRNDENNSNIKNKIISELQNIGYNLSHSGTHYIAETILLIATLNYDSENLTKNTYPKVSEIYQKNLNSIKTNIIIATNAAYRNMDKTILKTHLRLPDYIKPTAKMIINAILKKL